MKVPDVIYLQYHGDEPVTRYDEDDNLVTIPEDELGEVDGNEVTWCSDRIYDGDIPYRRDDQVCVWEYEGPSSQVYRTGCGERQGWTFPYCPYCGNRIRVEEAE